MGYLPGIETLQSEAWAPGAPGSSIGSLVGAKFPAHGTQRAALLLVHGFGEHFGRYARQIDFLNNNGVTVYTFDLPGHGRSSGTRALVDVGELVRPVHEGLLKAQRAAQRDGVPLLLLGHSMGGLLAATIAIRVPGAIAGLFLSGPALLVGANYPDWYKKLGDTLGRLAPAFPAANLDVDNGLSRIREYVEDYNNDPLVYHRAVPARTAATMMRLADATRQQAGALNTPTTIIHGDADTLAPIAGSREFAFRAAAAREARDLDPSVRLVEFPDGRHELFNDTDAAEAYDALGSWLEQSLG